MGADQVRSVAGTELGNYFFAINDQYVGSAMTTVMSALLCTSAVTSSPGRTTFAYPKGIVYRSSGTSVRSARVFTWAMNSTGLGSATAVASKPLAS